MKKYVIFGIVFSIVSCTSAIQKPEPPEDLIEKKKMIQVTTKIMQMDAHIQLSYGDLSRFHRILNSSNAAILDESKVSRDQYDRSFTYYSSDPKLMEEIYQGVLLELKKDENR